MNVTKSIQIRCIAFVALLILVSCTPKILPQSVQPKQANYFPSEIVNLYIGMPFEDFAKEKKVKKMDANLGKTVSYYTEKQPTEQINQVVYQFDAENKLYEIIVAYGKGFDVAGFTSQRYGKPLKPQTWLFEISKDSSLLIWIHENKLCIGDASHFEP